MRAYLLDNLSTAAGEAPIWEQPRPVRGALTSEWENHNFLTLQLNRCLRLNCAEAACPQNKIKKISHTILVIIFCTFFLKQQWPLHIQTNVCLYNDLLLNQPL